MLQNYINYDIMNLIERKVKLMITEFGKFLRILRISKEDSAKSMAEKLGVSVSYLSAVENGKRSIPTAWESILSGKYQLSIQETKQLRKAIAESSYIVKMDLSDVANKRKELLFTVARDDLDDALLDRLCDIIKQSKVNKS
jgi:transcriptional regulator with XRE-family HTH domain